MEQISIDEYMEGYQFSLSIPLEPRGWKISTKQDFCSAELSFSAFVPILHGETLWHQRSYANIN